MPSSHLILCHPLLFLRLIFPSIRVFSKESAFCIWWPKYWSFSISSSNEYSELISFRMDWLDLLAVQGTFKSLLEHHSSKAPILKSSVFFMVQLSHPYMTTGKNISSFQFSSVTQLRLTLWDPMDCSMPGFPVHHQHPELDQTQVHQVSDAIPPSHSLSSPSPPTFNLSQHQGLFQWVSSLPSGGQSIGVPAATSVLPMNTQDFRMDWLDLPAVQGTLKSLPQHHSSKASVLALSFLYSPILTSICDYWKNHRFD